MELTIDDWTFPPATTMWVYLRHPNGQTAASAYLGPGSYTMPGTLNGPGTCSLLADPVGAALGSVSLTLASP